MPIGSLLDSYPKASRLCHGHGWRSLRWVVPGGSLAVVLTVAQRSPLPALLEGASMGYNLPSGGQEPEIDQVQHYNTITQGQEERIPKT